jgi:membrane-associated protease RseP (regulator of RpoE activity)
MEVMSLTPELRVHFGATKNRGVIVARVERGSPADLAGVDVGDVIVGVRGKAIENATDVLSAISNAKKGDRVMIDVVRDGRRRSLEATLTANVPAFGNPGTSGSAWMRQWMAPPDGNIDGKQLHDLMRSFGPESSGAMELRKWFEELHDLLTPVPQSRDSA